MGLPKLKTKTSVEDYLESEKISLVKREYIFGEVYTRPENNINHNRIAGNILAALTNHLRDSSCKPFFGQTKVRVTKNIYYYPDILVSCEEYSENSYFCNAPILIIEVTSPSTRQIDCREKLLFYRQMSSVQEYAVVDQHRINIEFHRRQPNGGWITYFFGANDKEIEFQSVNLTLLITEIYRRVRFEKNADTTDDE